MYNTWLYAKMQDQHLSAFTNKELTQKDEKIIDETFKQQGCKYLEQNKYHIASEKKRTLLPTRNLSNTFLKNAITAHKMHEIWPNQLNTERNMSI